MMPIRTRIVGLILFMGVASPSFAQASLPQPDKDPFVGVWKASADKSRPKLNKIEASYIRTISREGDAVVLSSHIKRVTNAGFSENRVTLRCNGSPHRVQCGSASCTRSCMYVNENRVQGEYVSAEGKTSYWTEEVSSDGQETRIYSYADKDRRKLKTTEVLDRVK